VGGIIGVSSLYETDPVGGPEQGPYLNAVVLLDTRLGPRDLLDVCLAIERKRGRERRERWGPRTLDLDLLIHGSVVVDEPGLTVPHPRIAERRFVLEPLAEVWPDVALPGAPPMADLLAATSSQQVRRLGDHRWWEAVDPAEVLTTSPSVVSDVEAADVARSLFGIDGTAVPLVGERDRNFLLESSHARYSLKIANPAQDPVLLQMQQMALEHLAAVDPGLGVARAVPTISGELVGVASIGDVPVPVRLQTFLEGDLLPEGYSTAASRRSLAALLARLNRALAGFTHPAGVRDDLWDLTQLPALRSWTHYIAPDQREIIESEIDRFENSTLAVLAGLRRQMIHSDANPANLLTTPSDPDHLIGVIDFGDLVEGPLVVDIAIAAAYQTLGQDDPVAVVSDFVAAYLQELPLSEAEIGVIGGLVRGRLVQSLTISAWRAGLHPENEYILIYAELVWEALQLLLASGDSTFGAGS